MANFVLVHGAWHGAWCWQAVVAALGAQGHRCHALTLTGVGERAHLLSPAITLETHIADLRGLIEAEELDEVVLAVHSYAGMLGTALADRLPGRLKHLVYVDAVLPEPGETWSSTHAADTRAARMAAIAADPLGALAPPDATIFGLGGEQRDWVNRRQTPHPGRPYGDVLDFDPARAAQVPRTFISCTAPRLATIDVARARALDARTWSGHWLARSRSMELATGHDPMVSAPDGLCRLLLDCATVRL